VAKRAEVIVLSDDDDIEEEDNDFLDDISDDDDDDDDDLQRKQKTRRFEPRSSTYTFASPNDLASTSSSSFASPPQHADSSSKAKAKAKTKTKPTESLSSSSPFSSSSSSSSLSSSPSSTSISGSKWARLEQKAARKCFIRDLRWPERRKSPLVFDDEVVLRVWLCGTVVAVSSPSERNVPWFLLDDSTALCVVSLDLRRQNSVAWPKQGAEVSCIGVPRHAQSSAAIKFWPEVSAKQLVDTDRTPLLIAHHICIGDDANAATLNLLDFIAIQRLLSKS
jgi:hypothetical protein